ncbi:hypothetical protein SAMN04488490_1696 [Marinobacter sp. LV10R510-11A]|uniref:hypothetical protein n=1 Tax=Marinobacter sp. LV10R510-11A TaxID=1415568 RepID=UPI000BB8D5E5|nr:hypothetical protein [Marinobacter sp. LV10R510-11A]SOB76028.1 hypothetical protein SAMN04488490_1696 [Marinobacter sp. LV10R510-11A]
MSDPVETGSFTWSLGSNAGELLLNIDGESGPVGGLEFLGYYAGTFHTRDTEEKVMVPGYRSVQRIRDGEAISVLRYRLPEGTPLWENDASPAANARSDASRSDTGELFFDDGGQTYACRIMHSITPVKGGPVLWVDCTRSDGSGTRSFELWKL